MTCDKWEPSDYCTEGPTITTPPTRDRYWWAPPVTLCPRHVEIHHDLLA